MHYYLWIANYCFVHRNHEEQRSLKSKLTVLRSRILHLGLINTLVIMVRCSPMRLYNGHSCVSVAIGHQVFLADFTVRTCLYVEGGEV